MKRSLSTAALLISTLAGTSTAFAVAGPSASAAPVSATASSTSSATRTSPAAAAPAVEGETLSPTYCLRGDMNDGLIEWRFVTLMYGVNYYRYHVLNTDTEGNGECIDNPNTISGEWNADERTCFVAGVLAIPGAFIPGVGTVAAVYSAATTCGIALLT